MPQAGREPAWGWLTGRSRLKPKSTLAAAVNAGSNEISFLQQMAITCAYLILFFRGEMS